MLNLKAMKNNLILVSLLALFITIAGCSSGKKAYTRGDYYESVMKSINRLQRNPTHKKSVETLRDAYPMAVEYYESQARNKIASNDPNKWKAVVQYYNTMNYMYEQINRSPGALVVIPNPVNHYADLEEAKNNAAEESYSKGILAMEKGTRQDAKLAYANFRDADSFIPGYMDVNQKMEEALWAATLKVVIEPIPVIARNLEVSSEFFQNKFYEYLHDQHISEFVKFYTLEEANTIALASDHVISVGFDEFTVGQVYFKEKEVLMTKDSVLLSGTGTTSSSLTNNSGSSGSSGNTGNSQNTGTTQTSSGSTSRSSGNTTTSSKDIGNDDVSSGATGSSTKSATDKKSSNNDKAPRTSQDPAPQTKDKAPQTKDNAPKTKDKSPETSSTPPTTGNNSNSNAGNNNSNAGNNNSNAGNNNSNAGNNNSNAGNNNSNAGNNNSNAGNNNSNAGNNNSNAGNNNSNAGNNNSGNSGNQGNASGKVTICHSTSSGKAQTLQISSSALKAHLDHGDIVGKCITSTKTKGKPSNSSSVSASSAGVNSSNLTADSGNSVYGTVKATVFIYTKTITSNGVLDFKIIDNKSGSVISQEKMPGEYVWVTQWATFNGDERALTPEQLQLSKLKEAYPPSKQDLFIEFTRPIYDQMIDKVNRYYKRY